MNISAGSTLAGRRELADPSRILRTQLRLSQQSNQRSAEQSVREPNPGLGRDAPGSRVRALVERLLYVQYDPISTVAPSHVITTFARDPGQTRAQVDAGYSLANGVVEGWMRVACFLTVEDFLALEPEYQRRRSGPLRYGERVRVGEDIHDLARVFYTVIEAIGPATARQVTAHLATGTVSGVSAGDIAGVLGRRAGTWKSSVARTVLTYLWYRGYLTITARGGAGSTATADLHTSAGDPGADPIAGLEPVFDLTGRALPEAPPALTGPPAPAHPQEESLRDLLRALVLRQTHALVAATSSEIAWHLGQPAVELANVVSDLAGDGELVSFTIPGARQLYYATPDLWEHLNSPTDDQLPARDGGDAESLVLLSPFDPLLAHRDRFERLSGISFRADLFTPQQDRTAPGFYPLMLMQDGRPLGKLWVKTDHATKRLQRLSFQPFASALAGGETVATRKLARTAADVAAEGLAAFQDVQYRRRAAASPTASPGRSAGASTRTGKAGAKSRAGGTQRSSGSSRSSGSGPSGSGRSGT